MIFFYAEMNDMYFNIVRLRLEFFEGDIHFRTENLRGGACHTVVPSNYQNDPTLDLYS